MLGAALGGILLDQTSSGISTSSLPYVQGAFALSPDQGSWFLTLFNAAYWSAILASVWGITRMGRKRFFVRSCTAVAVLSFACALTREPWLLFTLRIAQGFALGGIFVNCAMIIFTAHRPAELPRAFIGFSTVSLAGSTLGPLIGGSLNEFSGWVAAFLWEAALAAVIAVIAIQTFPDDRTGRRIRHDFVGLAISVVAIVAFQFCVNDGERRDWFDDAGIRVAAVLAIVFGAAFLWWKLFVTRRPYFNVRVLSNLGLLLGASTLGLLAIPQYNATILNAGAQAVMGFSPTEGGWLLAERVAVFCVAIPATGLLILNRVMTPRFAIITGLVIFGATIWASAELITSGSDNTTFAAIGIAIAISQSMINQPLPALIFGGVAPNDSPMAAVVFKFAPLVGGGVIGALTQHALTVATAQHLSDLAGVAQGAAAGSLRTLVATQATTLAYADVMRSLAIGAWIVVPLALIVTFIVKPRAQPKPVSARAP